MNKWMIAICAWLLVNNFAQAQEIRCDVVTQDMSVPAKTRMQFARACEHSRVMKTCIQQANKKNLSGAKRDGFMKSCTGNSSARRN